MENELITSAVDLSVVGFGLITVGASFSIALTAFGAVQSIARQPEMQSRIFTVFIMAAAMIEALGLLGFVLAFVS